MFPTPMTRPAGNMAYVPSPGALGLLRFRHYDPTIGRFTSFDEFEGDPQDPRTLHKYLYAHANPIDNIDPTGQFSVASSLSVGGIQSIISSGVGFLNAAYKGA